MLDPLAPRALLASLTSEERTTVRGTGRAKSIHDSECLLLSAISASLAMFRLYVD